MEITSASITLAIEFTLECALLEVINKPRKAFLSSFLSLQVCLAATKADKFATVPPLVKTPKAVSGNPVKDTNHSIARFSQNIAPAPSIQYAPWIEEAEVIKSNKIDALVGEAGTKAKFFGWSTGTVAFTKTSLNREKAFSPPIPFSVIVSPTNANSSSSAFGAPSSGWVSEIRLMVYFITSIVISTRSISNLCMLFIKQ